MIKTFKAIPQWCPAHRKLNPEKPGKYTKIPLNAFSRTNRIVPGSGTGRYREGTGKPHAGERTAGTYAVATKTLAHYRHTFPQEQFELGFVFSHDDTRSLNPVFFDSDDCFRIDDTGHVTGWLSNTTRAQHLYTWAQRAGAFVGYSSSGRGFHVYAMYQGAPPFAGTKEDHLEVYFHNHFALLSTAPISGDAGADVTPSYHDSILVPLFPRKLTMSTGLGSDSMREVPASPLEGYVSLTDEQVVTAMTSNADLAEVWNEEEPSGSDVGRVEISLAYFCGWNLERVAGLMLSHEPWNLDDRCAAHGYEDFDDWLRADLARTWQKQTANGAVPDYYRGARPSDGVERMQGLGSPDVLPDDMVLLDPNAPDPNTPDPSTAPDLDDNPAGRILAKSGQLKHFTGCVYVIHLDRVLIPGGALLNEKQFKVVYGGYDFVLTSEGKAGRNAYEAFTQSHLVEFPKADHGEIDFGRPCGNIRIDEHKKRIVNLVDYCPGPRVPGDPKPGLDLLERLLPDAGDRHIFLTWCAGVIQRPDFKPKWAPILQGSKGNGKTTWVEILVRAIGEAHCFELRNSKLKAQFNGWAVSTRLAYVPEVRTRGDEDILNELKTMITDERTSVERKGLDAFMTRTSTAFFFVSNYLEAITIDADERRYAPFPTAQQTMADLERDGLTETYFTGLYDWLENRDGYATMATYLDSYAVNWAMLQGRAPITTGRELVERASLPVKAQLIQEAIDSEERGFRGGFVTSTGIKTLFNRERVNPRMISKYMLQLGYVPHPTMERGRVRLTKDSSRATVYIKAGSPHTQLRNGPAIAAAILKIEMNADSGVDMDTDMDASVTDINSVLT